MRPVMSFSDVFYWMVRVPFAIAWPTLQWERMLHFVTCGFVLFGDWFRSWWISCNRLQRRGTKRGLQKECISPEIFWIKVSTFSILAPAFYTPPPPPGVDLGANSVEALIIKQGFPSWLTKPRWSSASFTISAWFKSYVITPLGFSVLNRCVPHTFCLVSHRQHTDLYREPQLRHTWGY